MLRWFHWYSRRYVAKHFHAVRMARSGGGDALRAKLDEGRPVVLLMNHAAWWDPLVGMLAHERLFPGRRAYAPIDAAALGRYRFMERLGLFGVEPDTRGGGRRFLEVGERVLAASDTVLWLTPQGRFADPRERPVQLRPGAAHLARRCPHAVFVPLAVEYPFWEERTPEVLLMVGQPVDLLTAVRENGVPKSLHNGAIPETPANHRTGETPASPSKTTERRTAGAAELTARFAGALEEAQDELAKLSLARRTADFDVWLRGRTGIGGVYDLWRRVKAWSTGRRFRPEHGDS